jgi:hypothetical protein
VLEYFEWSNGSSTGKYNIASCNFCGTFRRVNVGIDAIRAHLTGADRTKAISCSKVPPHIREGLKLGTIPSKSHKGTSRVLGGGRQSRLGESVDPKLRDTAERAIASWAFVHGISFNAIDNDMFREAVKAVGRAGLSFQPPGRKKLSGVLLDSIYDETCAAVDMAVRDSIHFGLSICSDGWSNVRGNPIIHVMCMTVKGQFFRASVDASDAVKDAEYLHNIISVHVEELGPQNVVCVVSDNASNCKEAGRLIEERYPNITWVGCIPHCLNLLLKDLGELSWVKQVVQGVSKVFPHCSPAHPGIVQAHSHLFVCRL